MPKLAGGGTPIPWIGAGDVGAITATVLGVPERYAGQVLTLASDVQSVEACRAIFRAIAGKAPPRFPMPVWLLERFAGPDVTRMWRWLRTGTAAADPAATRAIHPGALGVEAWLRHALAARRP